MTGQRVCRWAFVALWLLHAGQCLRCFPTWESIVDDRPILAVDHALHLYHGSLGSTFLRQGGATWGYDPSFMAGYPKTPIHDPSAALSDGSQFVAGGGYRPAAYKIGLLATLLTGPLLFYGGVRLAGINAPAAVVAAALAGIYLWIDFPKALLDSGLYGFVWACAWLAWLLGWTTYWRERPSFGSWLTLVGSATAAFCVHPTLSVMAAPALLGWAGLHAGTWIRRPGWSAATIAAALIALGGNLIWILPLVRFWHWRGPQFHFMTAPDDEPWFFASFYLPTSVARLLVAMGKIHPNAAAAAPSDNWLLAALMIGGLVGVGRWLWLGRRSEATSFGLAICWLFGLTFFGSMVSFLRPLEPLRYQAPLHALACVPLGDLLVAVLGKLVGRPNATALNAAGGAAAVFGLVVWPGNLALGPSARELASRKFPIGLTTEMSQMVDWIRGSTDNSARILFEDQLRLRERTIPESLHWTPLLPILTGRQFVGGQYQCTPLLHHVASFGDFELGQRPIDRYAAGELAEYLTRYNIGWVVCWSPKARAVFDWFEGVEKAGELPRAATPGLKPTEARQFLYSVKTRGSFFARGKGRVVGVGPNLIELADLEPDAGSIVLRFHWFEALHIESPAKIVRVAVANDPVGFIGIETSSRIDRATIRVKYP